MDKLSVKVLKLIAKAGRPVTKSEIVDKYGDEAISSLEYLKEIKYIHEEYRHEGLYYDRDVNDLMPRLVPGNVYDLKPIGKDFLESHPGKGFDRWVTRICAIIGAITGISALVWEIIDHLSAG